MKKQYDWGVKVPSTYRTEERDEMCKMLEGAKIIRAKSSEYDHRIVIITTEEKE